MVPSSNRDIPTLIYQKEKKKGYITCEHENGVSRKPQFLNKKVPHTLDIIDTSFEPVTLAMVIHTAKKRSFPSVRGKWRK